MQLSDVRRNLGWFGPARTVADLLFRVLNRVVLLHVVKAVAIERANPSLLVADQRYRFGRLDREMLGRLTHDPDYELTGPFLDQAFARGDECWGFLHGDVLAAYSWYTRLPTLVGLPGVSLHFGEGWVHIYKGYTHPAHRGRRLHGRGMAQALAIHRGRGALGLVTYVDLTSFGALRSVYRTGYFAFGSTVILRLFGRYLLWASPGCRRCGFRLESKAPAASGGALAPAPAPGPPRR